MDFGGGEGSRFLGQRLRERTSIICVGNEMGGDDAFGYLVYARISRPASDSVQVLYASTLPESCITEVLDFKPVNALIIDAADFSGAPGELRLFTASELSGFSVSSETLTRLRPASANDSANRDSSTPFVVIDTLWMPGVLAMPRTISTIFARTVGSPPVRRILSKPRSANRRVSVNTSSFCINSALGWKVWSSGMQYTQRRLQWSVRLIRR